MRAVKGMGRSSQRVICKRWPQICDVLRISLCSICVIWRFGIMIKAYFSSAIACMAGLVISGCAAPDGRYPSLAVRDAERVSGEFTPQAQPTGVPVVQPDSGRIDTAIASAKQANIKFLSQSDEVSALVAASRGTGQESDVRARALVGVASLTSLRGQTAGALSQLDALEAQAATSFAETGAIRDAQATVVRMLSAQDQILETLTGEGVR